MIDSCPDGDGDHSSEDGISVVDDEKLAEINNDLAMFFHVDNCGGVVSAVERDENDAIARLEKSRDGRDGIAEYFSGAVLEGDVE